MAQASPHLSRSPGVDQPRPRRGVRDRRTGPIRQSAAMAPSGSARRPRTARTARRIGRDCRAPRLAAHCAVAESAWPASGLWLLVREHRCNDTSCHFRPPDRRCWGAASPAASPRPALATACTERSERGQAWRRCSAAWGRAAGLIGLQASCVPASAMTSGASSAPGCLVLAQSRGHRLPVRFVASIRRRSQAFVAWLWRSPLSSSRGPAAAGRLCRQQPEADQRLDRRVVQRRRW